MGLLHKLTRDLAPDTKVAVCIAPSVVIGFTASVTIRALTVGRPVLRVMGIALAFYPVGKVGEKVTEWMWKELHPTAPTP